MRGDFSPTPSPAVDVVIAAVVIVPVVVVVVVVVVDGKSIYHQGFFTLLQQHYRHYSRLSWGSVRCCLPSVGLVLCTVHLTQQTWNSVLPLEKSHHQRFFTVVGLARVHRITNCIVNVHTVSWSVLAKNGQEKNTSCITTAGILKVCFPGTAQCSHHDDLFSGNRLVNV